MLLVPGLIAVAAGPLLYQLARGGRSLLAALDGFAVVAVAGLALLHIIPDSISLAGWTAAGAALAGLAAPSLIAPRLGGLARPARAAALLLGLAALILHAFGRRNDGGYPAVSSQTQWMVLLLLHRLPVGLTIWFLLRPVHGPGLAMGALAVTAAATAAGLALADAAGFLQSRGWGIFQAAAAGSLLHLLFQRSHPGSQRRVFAQSPRGSRSRGFRRDRPAGGNRRIPGFRRGRVPWGWRCSSPWPCRALRPWCSPTSPPPWSTPCCPLHPSTGCGAARRCPSRPAGWGSACRCRSAPAGLFRSIAASSSRGFRPPREWPFSWPPPSSASTPC